jgi:aminoglycoside phosphotransferase (APT) family kinase protein
VDALVETILAELQSRVRDWYPDADGTIKPDVDEVDARAFAYVIRVSVPRTGAPPARLIVKAGPGETVPDSNDRPRLVAITDMADRRRLELEALRMVEARLEEVGDPMLAAVRPLGLLPESSAVVMEAFEGEPLHRHLMRGPFQRGAARRPTTLARAAGRWLRVLHDTPPSTQDVRQAAPSDLAAAFASYGSFLSAARGSNDLDPLVAVGIEAVSRLPDPLPLAITHGDFAPRNILVDATGRLAVIDLLGRWQAPAYEDVAAFLVALHTSRANAVTRGVLFGPTFERLEPAFLAGYYGSEPVPRHAIGVYELLLVLDKWAARTSRRTPRGLRRVSERILDRHYLARSRLLARRLAEAA